MAEKVTQMVLKVDLQCRQCYKKIKKLLCKFPNIRDQVYDEKQNTVRITVICCCPEKIREKLLCEGGKTIKGIEIKEPEKPKLPEKKEEMKKEDEPEKPKLPKKKEEMKKEDERKSRKVRFAEPLHEPPQDIKQTPDQTKAKKSMEPEKLAIKLTEKAPKDDPPKNPEWIPKAPEPGYPPAYPVGVPWGPWYQGYTGGPWCQGYTGRPCYHGNGRLPQPPPCYVGYGYGYGYCGRGCNVGQCDCFSEEYPSACTIR